MDKRHVIEPYHRSNRSLREQPSSACTSTTPPTAMASRPKVIHSERPSPSHTPGAASTTATLRPKASMSSVAKVRRAPSPVKQLQPTPPSHNHARPPQSIGRRPPSALGRPTATLTPVDRGVLGLQAHFDRPPTNGRHTPLSPTSATSALSPASALSATGSSSGRQRRTSASSHSEMTARPAAAPAPAIRVKAKVTSLAKPQPLQPNLPPAVHPRPPTHSRSSSLTSVRQLPVSSKAPKSPPASPPRHSLPPAVHMLPPTPTRIRDTRPQSPQSPRSPPGSALSSQSSISVTTSFSSTSSSLRDLRDENGDERGAGRTPVPLFRPTVVNGVPESPVSVDVPLDIDVVSTSPTHERTRSIVSNSPTRERTRSIAEVDEDVRAEARTNRKIADLEITTASLLQLTTSLERARHQQSLEIRELRRKLREARLALPPRTYQSMKSTWEEEEPLEDEEDEDAEGDELNKDPAWQHIRSLVEDMLRVGRSAVEEGKDWFLVREGKVSGNRRVLTAGEVEELERQRKEDVEQEQEDSMERSTEGGGSEDDDEDDDARSDALKLSLGSPLLEDEAKHLDDWPG